MFAFGGGFDAANQKLGRMGQLLRNEFGEDVQLEDKVYYRDSIYTNPPTPDGKSTYADTSECILFAPNPDRNSITFTLKLANLFDGFSKVVDGKVQGTNLFFGVDKELLGESLCSEVTKRDAIYQRMTKEQGLETPYHANGAYNFRSFKFAGTDFKFLRLDLGEQFLLAVEVVEGKESKL